MKMFIIDDYEFVVFNDAKNFKDNETIRTTCERLGIRCIRYEQDWHETDALNNQILQWLTDPSLIHSHIDFRSRDLYGISTQPSVRHSHVIQYALDNFGYRHDDIVVIMDGDIFPIRPLHFSALLRDSPLVGIKRGIAGEGVEYLWVPFIAFDPSRLPNIKDLKFHVALIGGYIHDTGAQTYHYLGNNPSVEAIKYNYHGSTSFLNMVPSEMKLHGFSDDEIILTKNLPWPQCVEFHLEHCLLHFGASSFCLEGHDVKSACVEDFIEKIVRGHQ